MKDTLLKPEAPDQLQAASGSSAPPCSRAYLLARIEQSLTDLRGLEEDARGPSRHEIFMSVHAAKVKIEGAKRRAEKLA